MIKCEEGVFRAQGSNATLKAELAIIIESLKKCFAEKMGQEEADKEIREAIRLGFMTEEEFEKELEKELKKAEQAIPEEIRRIIGDIIELIRKENNE